MTSAPIEKNFVMEERQAREAAKLEALRLAAQLGFDDLDQGRFQDVRDDELEAFLDDLGRPGSRMDIRSQPTTKS